MNIPDYKEIYQKYRNKENLTAIEHFIMEWAPDDHEQAFVDSLRASIKSELNPPTT